MITSELEKLKILDKRKQITFAYLTCERLFRNYLHFSTQYKFGNPILIRNVIDQIRRYINGYELTAAEAKQLINTVSINSPLPEKYDSIYASSALDACTVIIDSLNFIFDENTSRLVDISTMAFDTVDMFIQERDNLDFNVDMEFENKIQNDKLYKTEENIQIGIINYLTKIDSITEDDLNELNKLQKSGTGNINYNLK